MQSRVDSAEKNISTNTTDIESLKESTTQNQKDIQNLQSKSDTYSKNIADLQDDKLDKTYAEKVLNDISFSRVESVLYITNKYINLITGATTNTNIEVPVATSEQSGIMSKEDFEALQQCVSNITSINESINSINESIKELTDKISNSDGNIDNLSKELESLKTEVYNNTNSINGINSEVTRMNSEISSNKNNITKLTNDKLNKNFTTGLVTDISITQEKNSNVVKLIEKKINPSNNETSEESNNIPLASGTSARYNA